MNRVIRAIVRAIFRDHRPKDVTPVGSLSEVGERFGKPPPAGGEG